MSTDSAADDRTGSDDSTAEARKPEPENLMSLKVAERGLIPHHQAALLKQAIPLELAAELGIYSAVVAADLPDDLAYYRQFSDSVPSIVFPLPKLDGTVIHQVRKDNVELAKNGTKGAKYLQTVDTGSIITVHPPMRERVSTATTMVIVEGTKQCIAAIAAVLAGGDDMAHILIIGVQGCQNWQAKGVPLGVFDELMSGGCIADVVILFDADRTAKLAVYQGATKLAAHMKLLEAKTVRFTQPLGNGTTGLDDFLGTSVPDPANRPRRLAAIIKEASARPGPAPKPPRATVASRGELICDWESGTTRRAPESEGADGEIVYDFAARIAETFRLHFEGDRKRAPVTSYEVEFALRNDDGPAILFRTNIPHSKLDDIEAMLATYPGGESLAVPATFQERTAVANAFRACRAEDTISTRLLGRTGWAQDIDGTYRFLHAGGSLGPDGNDPGFAGRLQPGYVHIDYPDPTEAPEQTVIEAVRASLSARDLLIDRAPWHAGIGLIGKAPAGPIPFATIMIVGEPGSGKSYISQTLTAFQSPQFATGGVVMGNADATVSAINAAGDGMNNSFVLMDDVRVSDDRNRNNELMLGIDYCTRRAFGSGGRERAPWNAEIGDTAKSAPSTSHPAYIFSSEEILTSSAGKNSMNDRMLSVVVKHSTTFRPGDANRMKDLAWSGQLQLAYAAYIVWLSRKIAAMGEETGGDGLVAWCRHVDRLQAEATAEVLSESGPGSGLVSKEVLSRGLQLVLSLSIGVDLYTQFAEEIGALGALDAELYRADATVDLFGALNAHTREVMGGNESAAGRMIAEIHGVLFKGRYIILADEDDDPGPGQTVVGAAGRSAKVDGEPVACVALSPAGIAEALKVSKSVVISALRDVAIRDADGKSTRTTTLTVLGRSTKPRCLFIPLTVWNGAATE